MFKRVIQLVACLILFLAASKMLFADGSEKGSSSEPTKKFSASGFQRGLNEWSIWSGYSFASMSGKFLALTPGRQFAVVGVQYGRILAAGSIVALAYTFDVIPMAMVTNNPQTEVTGVTTISASEYLPATGVSRDRGLKKTDSEEFTDVAILAADENFIDNLELNIVAGRNLPATTESSEHFILVNETAAKSFGYEEASQIVGQLFLMESAEDPVEVIGVIEDFYFESALTADKIGPFMLHNQPEKFTYVNLKIASSDLKGVIANLEAKWKGFDLVHPFKYHFFDEQVAVLNQALGDLLSILGFIAFLAVTIACLGLLGMAMYNTERRRKEIGIRKVLGAASAKIVLLLSKDFLKMLMISILIAAPLSYFVNNAWLQNFPNRVEFGFGTVFLGSVILLMLGLITIGSQTLKAAGSNPVDSLRME